MYFLIFFPLFELLALRAGNRGVGPTGRWPENEKETKTILNILLILSEKMSVYFRVALPA